MKAVITVMGMDAVHLGMACNRQPEVLNGNHWKTASSFPEAQRAFRDDPNSVRLSASPRVLVEDIAKRSMPMDTNVEAALALLKDDSSIDADTRRAYTIIWNAMQ